MGAIELEGEKEILLGEASTRNSSYLNLLSLCSRLAGKVQEDLHIRVFHGLNTLVCFFHQREKQVGGGGKREKD